MAKLNEILSMMSRMDETFVLKESVEDNGVADTDIEQPVDTPEESETDKSMDIDTQQGQEQEPQKGEENYWEKNYKKFNTPDEFRKEAIRKASSQQGDEKERYKSMPDRLTGVTEDSWWDDIYTEGNLGKILEYCDAFFKTTDVDFKKFIKEYVPGQLTLTNKIIGLMVYSVLSGWLSHDEFYNRFLVGNAGQFANLRLTRSFLYAYSGLYQAGSVNRNYNLRFRDILLNEVLPIYHKDLVKETHSVDNSFYNVLSEANGVGRPKNLNITGSTSNQKAAYQKNATREFSFNTVLDDPFASENFDIVLELSKNIRWYVKDLADNSKYRLPFTQATISMDSENAPEGIEQWKSKNGVVQNRYKAEEEVISDFVTLLTAQKNANIGTPHSIYENIQETVSIMSRHDTSLTDYNDEDSELQKFESDWSLYVNAQTNGLPIKIEDIVNGKTVNTLLQEWKEKYGEDILDNPQPNATPEKYTTDIDESAETVRNFLRGIPKDLFNNWKRLSRRVTQNNEELTVRDFLYGLFKERKTVEQGKIFDAITEYKKEQTFGALNDAKIIWELNNNQNSGDNSEEAIGKVLGNQSIDIVIDKKNSNGQHVRYGIEYQGDYHYAPQGLLGYANFGRDASWATWIARIYHYMSQVGGMSESEIKNYCLEQMQKDGYEFGDNNQKNGYNVGLTSKQRWKNEIHGLIAQANDFKKFSLLEGQNIGGNEYKMIYMIPNGIKNKIGYTGGGDIDITWPNLNSAFQHAICVPRRRLSSESNVAIAESYNSDAGVQIEEPSIRPVYSSRCIIWNNAKGMVLDSIKSIMTMINNLEML